MAVCPNCNERKKIYGSPDALLIPPRWKGCPSCDETGHVSGANWRKCGSCGGWGEILKLTSLGPEPCTECNGRGIVPSKASEESGKKRRGRSIRIDFD